MILPGSLRRRLLLLLLPAIALVWLGTGVHVYQETEDELEEVLDAELAQTARLLAVLTRVEVGRHSEVAAAFDQDGLADLYNRYEHKIAFRIVNPEGKLLLASPDAPAGLAGVEHGQCETRHLGASDWRIFGLRRGFGWIYTGTPLDLRDEMMAYVLRNGLWPILLSLVVLSSVVWWSVGRGMRPLDDIAAQVALRRADDLSPLDMARAPSEVRPLTTALNSLFERLDASFELERRFTADAAHELRTPLSAIRIQAEVALQAADPAERDRALQQILSGADLAGRLTNQLLALARADAESPSSFAGRRADLDQIAESLILDLGGQAVEGGIDLGLDCPAGGNWSVKGDATALAILLRNLIDNAIRYTPPGGEVLVVLRRMDGAVRLAVVDNGPGIPEAERAAVFGRFHRASTAGETSGSGLGFSIVERIASLHGAWLQLGPGLNGRGLGVVIGFPPMGAPGIASQHRPSLVKAPKPGPASGPSV